MSKANMVPPQCIELVRFLKKRYPLPKETKLLVELIPESQVQNPSTKRMVSGTFTVLSDRKLRIRIAIQQVEGRRKVLETIAHEYKHAHQVAVEGLKINGEYFGEFESDARDCAPQFVEEFLCAKEN